MHEQGQLARSLDKQNEDKANLMRMKDMEGVKNRDLSASLYDLESKCRARDEQLAETRKEGDELRFSNTSMAGRNTDVRGEIDAL